MRIVFEGKRAQFAKNLSLLPVLFEKLKHYERRVTEKGSDVYGSFSSVVHDDIATVLGISLYIGERHLNILRVAPKELVDLFSGKGQVYYAKKPTFFMRILKEDNADQTQKNNISMWV